MEGIEQTHGLKLAWIWVQFWAVHGLTGLHVKSESVSLSVVSDSL